MIIELSADIAFEKLQDLRETCVRACQQFTEVQTQSKRLFILFGTQNALSSELESFDGVRGVFEHQGAQPLVSNGWREDSIIPIGDKHIGAGNFALALGPCAVESEQQIDRVISHLTSEGISFIRGGVFKPRTSAYSFRGLGLEALRLLAERARAAKIKVISEITSQRMIEPMHDLVDVFQVGTRNMQNFCLLHELGKAQKPVLLKRGFSATLDEFLHSAEHVYASGNEQIILCERGIRTFEKSYRNTLDLNAVPYLKSKTHLPVMVDPSHGTGVRSMVMPMACASVMAGADGLLIEVHPDPDQALSDGAQSLSFEQSSELIRNVRATLECRENLCN